MIDSKKLLVQK